MQCWICGADAETGEHIVKRSDLAGLFPLVSQTDPIHIQKGEARNQRVGTLKSKKLTHDAKLCGNCNNNVTQPYDIAWQQFASALHAHRPRLNPGATFRAQRVFPHFTHRNLLRVHLFFVKAFGCMIQSGGANIPIEPFADAILSEHAHPNIYLKFGYGIDEKVAGTSELWVCNENDVAVYATWIYQVGRLWVNLMFAQPGQHRDGMIGAWRPMQRTSRFQMANFR